MIKNHLPNIALLRHMLVIEDGELLWSATKRPATVPQLFKPNEPLVVFGWLVLWEHDVRYALEFGVWPDCAATRPEPHVHRRDFARANRLMGRNAKQLEIIAAGVKRGKPIRQVA